MQRAFYFSNEFLETLFTEQGFEVEEHDVCCKQVENRSRELVMNRRWVQATFRLSNGNKNPCDSLTPAKLDKFEQQDSIQSKSEEQERKEIINNTDIDISDGLAMEMFGASPSSHEVRDFGNLIVFRYFVQEYFHFVFTLTSSSLFFYPIRFRRSVWLSLGILISKSNFCPKNINILANLRG